MRGLLPGELSQLPAGILANDITIAAAAVKALNATPVVVLQPPGAGYGYIFEGAVIHKPAGVAYDGIAAGEDLSFLYVGGAEVGRCEMTGFLDSAAAQTRFIKAYHAASAVSDVTPVENVGIEAQMLVGEVGPAGAPTLYIRTYYRLVPMAVF